LYTTDPWQAGVTRYFELWTPVVIDDAGLMEDLNFKNENINLNKGIYYVNVWATWCRPCLEEMTCNYEADSLLEANGIERLYISIDELDSRDKWLSMLYHYHLGGGNVLAGEKLKLFLKQELKIRTGPIIIPRYFFIKNGTISNKAAAGPSDFQRLIQQVKEITRRY